MPNTAYILEDAGFTRQQVDALTIHWEGSVATKADIIELRGELKADIAELHGKIDSTAADLRSEIKELRGDLKADIAELRTELKYVKWIGAAILVGVLIPIVKDLLV